MPEHAAPPAVSVVVVSHESGPHLARCLDALRRQTMADFEVIVIDNASADRATVAAALPAADSRFRLLAQETNIGFAAAGNLAARMAAAPWLALLNPDAFAAPDWLSRLLAATRRHPSAAAFGSTQLLDSDPTRLDGAGDAYHALGFPWRMGRGHPVGALPPGDRPAFSVCAAAALYDRRAFLAAGGFDETYFCYVEDVDLGFRLRLAGHTAMQVADAVVRHVGGGSGGADPAFARYHGTRNMIWTMAKDMPGPLLAGLLPAHLLVSGAAAVVSWLTGHGTARLRGLLDGFLGLPRVFRGRAGIQGGRKLGPGAVAGLLCRAPGPYLRRDIVGIKVKPADAPAAGKVMESGHG